MPDEQVIDDLLLLFQPGSSVVVSGHINPDGDSIGSVLALAEFLTARGCLVTKLLARGTKAPELYSFLEGYNWLPAEQYSGSPDIFIAVDLSQAHRLDAAQGVLARARTKVVIDHHPGYDGFADHVLSDTSIAASGLLVWQLLQASGEAITRSMATACYVALMTDTGRFTYQNTTAGALAAAAQMVEAGADAAMIARAVYDSRPWGAIKLDARLIERMEFLIDPTVVSSWVTMADYMELGVTPDESESLVNILRSLAGVELAILLREDDIQVRVNLRARGSYNASKLARDHGGGGHQAAAGFNFAGTIQQAREAVRHYLVSEAILTSGADPSISVEAGQENV
ncbi:MAG: DHH family phosphoesterase [Coriobacteriales bacterium]|jgi:phosphoesterase RecJ-like protein|nr:DHH family phosphoesterase [Coriobacteriales bacterium]